MNFSLLFAKISSLTLLSRILGFVRDFLIAFYFGVSNKTDIFFVTFRIPNLLRRFFAEGAFNQAFLPSFSEIDHNSHVESKKFFCKCFTFLALILISISFFAIVFSSYIVFLVAPGFYDKPNDHELLFFLFKITFPYIFFISLTSICSAVLNTRNYFSIPAFTPAILNLSFIFFIIFLSPLLDEPIISLGLAVFFGGLFQLILQIYYLKKINFWPIKLNFQFKDTSFIKTLKLMIPGIIGGSASQISLLVNTILASFMISGVITWIYYADRFMELPIALVSASIGTILLAKLSEYSSKNQIKEFKQSLINGIYLSIIFISPFFIAFNFFGIPIISSTLFFGKFQYDDVIQINSIVIIYAYGIFPMALNKILANVFFSIKDTQTPAIGGLISILITQLINFIFIWDYGFIVLAYSLIIGSYVNLLFLLIKVKKDYFYEHKKSLITIVVKVFTILLPCAFLLSSISSYEEFWRLGSPIFKLTVLFLVIILLTVYYYYSLKFFKISYKNFKV